MANEKAARTLGVALVVDDDREHRDIVAQAVLEAGWEVRTATDGEAALASLESAPRPTLVLLDMLMPRMDGAEVLARLRDHPDREIARVPVVIMTGMPHHARALLLPYTADGMLVKPFALKDLRATLSYFSSGPDREPGPSRQS